MARFSFNTYTLFLAVEDFLTAAAGYFEWVDETPLLEERVHISKDGVVTRANVNKMRPYTKTGLCLHIRIPTSRLATYRNNGGDWAEAVQMVEDVLYTQKFEGAAANLLNASIISRDLGLAEKTEVTGDGGGPLQLEAIARDATMFTSRILSLSARVAGAAGVEQISPTDTSNA